MLRKPVNRPPVITADDKALAVSPVRQPSTAENNGRDAGQFQTETAVPRSLADAKQALERATLQFGKDHWKTIDASLNVELFEILEKLTPEQLKQFNEATRFEAKVSQIIQKGAYRDAVPLARHVVDFWERLLGPVHPQTATSLNNLAYLYQTQGNNSAAEPLFQRARKIEEKALGPRPHKEISE